MTLVRVRNSEILKQNRKKEKKKRTEEKNRRKEKALNPIQAALETRNIALMQIFVKTLTGTTAFNRVLRHVETNVRKVFFVRNITTLEDVKRTNMIDCSPQFKNIRL